ncbi:hypothetical protein C8R43DRAFT_964769 [Mycena crocata]|nr:hypothetical protein C8R43DRAFT_964769 [Mycena crocata]
MSMRVSQPTNTLNRDESAESAPSRRVPPFRGRAFDAAAAVLGRGRGALSTGPPQAPPLTHPNFPSSNVLQFDVSIRTRMGRWTGRHSADCRILAVRGRAPGHAKSSLVMWISSLLALNRRRRAENTVLPNSKGFKLGGAPKYIQRRGRWSNCGGRKQGKCQPISAKQYAADVSSSLPSSPSSPVHGIHRELSDIACKTQSKAKPFGKGCCIFQRCLQRHVPHAIMGEAMNHYPRNVRATYDEGYRTMRENNVGLKDQNRDWASIGTVQRLRRAEWLGTRIPLKTI